MFTYEDMFQLRQIKGQKKEDKVIEKFDISNPKTFT